MEVKKKTIRSEAIYDAMVVKMFKIVDEIAAEIDLPDDVVDVALAKYANLSARVEFGKKEVDFELATVHDTVEDIKAKFLAYFTSDCVDIVDQAAEQIRIMDRPSDAALAPDAPPESEKN